MNKYTTLFIDIDGTLLDFLKAENVAIKRAFLKNGLPDDEETARIYSDINKKYWEKFERNEIKKEDIFENRFLTFFEKTGTFADVHKLSEDYFDELSRCYFLMDGATEILEFLRKRGYYLCATTNGDYKTQKPRISESGLKGLFDLICISEETGYQKPEKAYFDFVVSVCPEKDREKILIIGDSQTSDVLGGLNSGIDTCWFNQFGGKPRYNATYEINSLSELKNIL